MGIEYRSEGKVVSLGVLNGELVVGETKVSQRVKEGVLKCLAGRVPGRAPSCGKRHEGYWKLSKRYGSAGDCSLVLTGEAGSFRDAMKEIECTAGVVEAAARV